MNFLLRANVRGARPGLDPEHDDATLRSSTPPDLSPRLGSRTGACPSERFPERRCAALVVATRAGAAEVPPALALYARARNRKPVRPTAISASAAAPAKPAR